MTAASAWFDVVNLRIIGTTRNTGLRRTPYHIPPAVFAFQSSAVDLNVGVIYLQPLSIREVHSAAIAVVYEHRFVAGEYIVRVGYPRPSRSVAYLVMPLTCAFWLGESCRMTG